MTNIFKNANTYFILIILGLIAYIYFHNSSVTNDSKITADEKKYDSLAVVDAHKLDSITSFYNQKIDTINTKISVANAQIVQTNQLIKSLQDAYNKESLIQRLIQIQFLMIH